MIRIRAMLTSVERVVMIRNGRIHSGDGVFEMGSALDADSGF